MYCDNKVSRQPTLEQVIQQITILDSSFSSEHQTMKRAMWGKTPSLGRVYDRTLILLQQQALYLRVISDDSIKSSTPFENNINPRQGAVSHNSNINTGAISSADTGCHIHSHLLSMA
jgi:hypothetical protein